MPPLSSFFHPISTKSELAQEQFNDALINFYGYTFGSAYIGFKRASETDPNCAMAYWGMAMAKGAMSPTKEEEKEIYSLVRKAESLSHNASQSEQDYIAALGKRYPASGSNDVETLKSDYKKAMEEVYKKYPDDLDAATLYVESLEYKDEKLGASILEWVLKRSPHHLGANHYYIHTTETTDPICALMSAHRFEVIKQAPPHILHMPSHIYILLGDYEKTVQANLRAIAHEKPFKERYGIKAGFPVHYYLFLVRAYMWQENYVKAHEVALETSPHDPFPYFQMLLYFHRYEELLKWKAPDSKDQSKVALWHFAKAIAYAATNKLDEANKEKQLFLAEKEKLQEEDLVVNVAQMLLEAQIAKVQGDKERQEKYLIRAIEAQRKMHFNEPPNWYYPIQQTLGAFYFQEGRLEEAEKAFRSALEELPRNGRTLYGLYTTLKAQNKDTYYIEREMKEALERADHHLLIEDL
jgi:tetratricopeptide (TPR) repeat protein